MRVIKALAFTRFNFSCVSYLVNGDSAMCLNVTKNTTEMQVQLMEFNNSIKGEVNRAVERSVENMNQKDVIRLT